MNNLVGDNMENNRRGGRRIGAGRRSIYQNKVAFTISISEEAKEILSDASSRRNMSRSDIIEELIRSIKKEGGH